MLGFGIIAAAILVDVLGSRLARSRAFCGRIVRDLDPLEPPAMGFLSIVADVLSATDRPR
jgi:hypothetical protein